MPKRRQRTPNRSATRKSPDLRVVTDTLEIIEHDPEPLFGLPASDDPAGDAEAARLAAEMARALFQGLAATRHPLDGELAVCSLFGVVETGVPEDASDSDREAALAMLLGQLIQHSRHHPGPAALAFLRVAAGLGPSLTRGAASLVLEELSAAGLSELPWTKLVGAPTLIRAWQYGDIFGEQTSLGLLFDYQHREHCLMLLIDHQLGGGIKDAYVVEGREARGLRDRIVREMRSNQDAEFADLSGEQALAVLRAALAAPPCPIAPDQIEDVGLYLYLVHSRAQMLADTLGESPVDLYAELNSEINAALAVIESEEGEDGDSARPAPAGDVLRIKVGIAGAKPPIWRRLEVPAATKLDRLHHILQTAFGWTDSHLHAFETGRRSWGAPSSGPALEGTVLRRRGLGDLAGAPGDVLTYVYDFGDDWVHTIEVEDRFPAVPGETYPRCTAGRRAGPREDSGGVPGYEHLLSVLADPGHPEHAEMSEWAGPLDPAAFDRETLNRHLAGYAVAR